jgi:hypothetical protein
MRRTCKTRRLPAGKDRVFRSDCEKTCLIASDGSVDWLSAEAQLAKCV